MALRQKENPSRSPASASATYFCPPWDGQCFASILFLGSLLKKLLVGSLQAASLMHCCPGQLLAAACLALVTGALEQQVLVQNCTRTGRDEPVLMSSSACCA